MRRLERWLHQHMFKVGWLLTKNLQTTTILYYTFFLPGVVLHEFIYWLVAGILNVRAERAIAWPEAQAIAELKLNFIKLARNTSRIKVRDHQHRPADQRAGADLADQQQRPQPELGDRRSARRQAGRLRRGAHPAAARRPTSGCGSI